MAALPPSLTLLQQTLRLYFQPSTLTHTPQPPLGSQASWRHLSCVFSIFSFGIPAAFINGCCSHQSLRFPYCPSSRHLLEGPLPPLVFTPPHSFPSCPFLRSCYPTLCVHFLLLLLSRLLLGCSSSPARAGCGGEGGGEPRAYIFVRLCVWVQVSASERKRLRGCLSPAALPDRQSVGRRADRRARARA